ncbi:uncharacterized protein JCM6883_002920 [Sporobolomyces salmoneus]|uniref:uncharacterized protein n=1 Tax=Sporobolomyces salmoneus TaxID=183962 RepID=UPI00316D6B65
MEYSESSNSANNSAGMQMRERRTRESSYHPMASDSEDGGISDGDPPFFSTNSYPASSLSHHASPVPTSLPSYSSAPPPPSTASATAIYSSARSTPNINTESLAGTAGGAPLLLASATSSPASSSVTTSKKGGGGPPKRSFEELEDIVFSNPKSFATLAFAIAESRGVTLIVSDDRTHKVTSAYMHIVCAYRKSGCPLILKLTKAKEGGWVLKVDPKQKSVYRCRHPAGAVPEIPSASSPSSSAQLAGFTQSYPMSSSLDKGVSKPKAARISSSSTPVTYSPQQQLEPSSGKAASSSSKGRIRPPAPSIPAPIYSAGSPARMTPITTLPAPGSALERALAPPFERSRGLSREIVPVLSSAGNGLVNGFSAPATTRDGRGEGDDSITSSPRIQKHSLPSENSNSLLSTVQIVAKSDSTSLPLWSKLLSALSSTSSPSQPSLLPLAEILSHPYMSLHPSTFYATTTPPEVRTECLEGLPVEKTGVWLKVWAKRVLVSEEAFTVWEEIARGLEDGAEEEDERMHEGEDETVNGRGRRMSARNGNGNGVGGRTGSRAAGGIKPEVEEEDGGLYNPNGND